MKVPVLCWWKLLATVVLTMFTAFVCFTNLDRTISSSDESIHISVVQEMFHSGEWWLPKYEGQPYFRKPPFKMWLSLIPVSAFGESNTSYRVLDALLGITLALMVLGFGTFMLNNYWGGWLGAFLLVFNRSFFVSSHGYRFATQDGMLHVLQFAALWIFYVWHLRYLSARDQPAVSLGLAYGIAVGLSLLTKSVAGLLAPGIACIFFCARREILPFIRRFPAAIAASLLTSIVIPGLYMLPHLALTPGFYESFFMAEVVERVSEGIHNQQDLFHYFIQLREGEFLPLPLLIGGLVFG